MAKDVFISYKAEEFDQADWVRTMLECRGIHCWMAPDSIPGGTSYATEIPKAIGECKVFVLILSSKAMRSKWVPREVDQAINREKTILPFVIEDCVLTDEFQFYLTNVQSYMAFHDRNNALEKMINQIQNVLRREQTAEQIRQKIRQNSGPGYSGGGNAAGGTSATASAGRTGSGAPTVGTSGGARSAGSNTGPRSGRIFAGAKGTAEATASGGKNGSATTGTTTKPGAAPAKEKKPPVDKSVLLGFIFMLIFCGTLEDGALIGFTAILVLLSLGLTIYGRANIRKTGKRGKILAIISMVFGCMALAPVIGLLIPGNIGMVLWVVLIVLLIILYRKVAGKPIGKKKK